MLFENLEIIEPILKSLKEEGYLQPTPIQQKSIPLVLKRNDLLACAQTGTGKTAAFAIPVLQILHEQKKLSTGRTGVKALVLTPTRELAIQIEESFKTYGKYTGLKLAVILGGASQRAQAAAIQRGVDIVVATPGRLLDLMQQNLVNIGNIDILVLDEADRMLDMGFVHDVKRIIAKTPAKRQTLFFSATMNPAILKLANTLLVNPEKVEVNPVSSTAKTVQQSVYFVEKSNKQRLLIHLLGKGEIDTALVFTRTKHGANKLAKALSVSGIRTEAIHGNKSQSARQMALNQFKNKQIKVLVATDVASRGIDIDQLSHVINYELPEVPETYVHRIGRTGRAGASGTALSFCDHEEKDYLRTIQKLIANQIPVEANHPYPLSGNHEVRQVVAAQSRRVNRHSGSRGRFTGVGR